MTDTTFAQGTIIEPTWLQDANDHVNDKTGIKHSASKISNTPAGNISATTVQAAIDELDTEKQPLHANLTALNTTASQAEMEAGTETALRAMSPKLVLDAITYNQSAYQNFFINGDMRVQQRPAVTPSSSRQIGQVDRWAYQASNASMTGSTNSLGGVTVSNRQVLNAQAAFTAANAHIFDQRVEAKECWSLGGKEITVSGYVWQNSSTSQNWYWDVYKATAGENNFSTYANIATGSASPTSVAASAVAETGWVRVSLTFTPAAADCAYGLEFHIRSANSAGALTSHNVRLRDCQLEIGGTATTFAPKEYSEELAACMRYWETSYAIGQTIGTASNTGKLAYVDPRNGSNANIEFKVDKVKPPAVTCYSSQSGTVNTYYDATSMTDRTPVVLEISESRCRITFVAPGAVDHSLFWHYVADAEL